ncbi:MAG: hypothetical protein F4W95_14465 [Chloroflexi bacterium]|nr:hypothetical protein [Chloroflexota bacterium]
MLRWDDGKTTEDLEEGQWYLAEMDEDGLQGKSFVMVTPHDRLTASYQCLVAGEGGIGSGPVVSIDYPEQLPENLAKEGRIGMVTVETVVNGEVLPVGWNRKSLSDRGILLGGEEAQLLVSRIWETDATSYRLRFPDHPELDRTVPSAGLGEIAGEVIGECESWDYGFSAVRELGPPQVVQEPVDGQYTYTAANGRFTLRYPADCGQMWEAPGLANNADRCPAGEPAISTSVAWHDIAFGRLGDRSPDPDQFARVFADSVAAGAIEAGALVSRYTLKTEADHLLEIVESRWESEEGATVLLMAHFVDRDSWMIEVYMAYPADGADPHRQRVLDAFKTFTAGEPAK